MSDATTGSFYDRACLGFVLKALPRGLYEQAIAAAEEITDDAEKTAAVLAIIEYPEHVNNGYDIAARMPPLQRNKILAVLVGKMAKLGKGFSEVNGFMTVSDMIEEIDDHSCRQEALELAFAAYAVHGMRTSFFNVAKMLEREIRPDEIDRLVENIASKRKRKNG